MKFVALYHSSSRDESMSLHVSGCAAIERDLREHGSNTETITANDYTEAVEAMLDEELRELGYGEEHVKVHACAERSNSRKRSGKEGTMLKHTIDDTGRVFTTLAEVEVGDEIRPVPGTYKARMTRTEQKRGKPATVTFGDEWAGSKYAKVERIGEAKRPKHFDVGLAGRTWSAYPGTVKVELKTTAAQRKANLKAAAAPKAAPVNGKAKRPALGSKSTMEGKAKAASTTKRARGGAVDNDLAAKVKKLRDEEGMAWWKIGQTLGLPGGGPLPEGKRGAGQARKLYRAANDGKLPETARSNGGSRNVSTRKPSPARRKRNALGLAAMNAAELREALEGKTITYNYSKPDLGTADPVKVQKVKTVKLVGKDQKLAVTFWSERSREGFGNERTVYADQIVEVR